MGVFLMALIQNGFYFLRSGDARLVLYADLRPRRAPPLSMMEE